MRHIVLISCVKSKGTDRAKACDLYQGDLFRKCLAFGRSLSPDAIYILSAKYGLLALETEIEPYDETLKTMPAAQVKAWSARVLEQLRRVTDLRADRFTFLAPKRYRRHLLPHMDHYDVPMNGLGIGQQLSYLKARTS
jgi:hypothetical protein